MADVDREHEYMTSRPEEIAVDLQYREMAISHLNALYSGSATPGDSDERLKLGLVILREPAQTAYAIKEKYPDPSPIARRPATTDTEVILDGLRQDIATENGRWFPRMGKVRNADVVGGLPHIGAGWEYPEKLPDEAKPLEIASGSADEGRGIHIGVIDCPMYPHPDLKGRWYVPKDAPPALSSANEYKWLKGHAVFVTSRILERAPGAQIAVYGILSGDTPMTTVWQLAKTMVDAADHGVTLLNLSLGCYTEDAEAPFVLERAVDVLTARGVTLVAAAGNHAKPTEDAKIDPKAPIFPAACPGVVAVGAHVRGDSSGLSERAEFSPDLAWVGLGAPGEGVRGAYLSGEVRFSQLKGLPTKPPDSAFYGYSVWSGTSFAAATISGEIARIMTRDGKSAAKAVEDLTRMDPDKNGCVGQYKRP